MCHPDLTIMVLLLTILFLLRKIPSGVTPKRARNRETRAPGVGHQLSPLVHGGTCQPGLLPRTDGHTCTYILTAPQPGPQMVGLQVGRARVPSLRIPIRGGQGTIETEVLRLDLYLGDFSGLGSVCPIDRAAGRANQPRGKNEDKPQRNTDQEMDKNIPWD